VAAWNAISIALRAALVGRVDDQLFCISVEVSNRTVGLHFLYGEKRDFHEELVEAIQDNVENGLGFEVPVPVDVTYGVAIEQWEHADQPRLFLRYGVVGQA
jgi:hypothetical protein